MRQVYLDNNATTMVAPEVVQAMQPFWSELYGNPSSMHVFGGQNKKHLDEARAQAATLIGRSAIGSHFYELWIGKNNMAIRGAVEAMAAVSATLLPRASSILRCARFFII